MKKIIFKSLSVKNFLSIGNAAIDIDFTEGVNLITGVNLDKEDASNGSGKSSLINAIYFCLYGKTLKDIKIDQIPNSYTEGSCEVSLSLHVENNNNIDHYIITRMLRPSRLKLQKNDQDITKSTIAKTTELLQQIITCTDVVFENSVVMDANNAITFMSQKKVEKRKFLEGILNLSVFGDMLSIARSDYNKTKYEFDVSEEKLKSCIDTLNEYKILSDKIEQQNNARGETIANKISLAEQKIQTLYDSLKQEISVQNLEANRTKVQKLKEMDVSNEKHIKDLIKQEAILGQEKKVYIAELNNLRDSVDVCGECDRPYTQIDKERIQKKRQETTAALDVTESQIQELKKQFNELELQQRKIKKTIQALLKKEQLSQSVTNFNSNVNWKIQQLKSQIEDLQAELNTSAANDYIQLVDNQKDKVRDAESLVSSLNIEVETLNVAKFILSEEGIRSYIVKKILRVLNGKINMYLRKLDANTKCEFNEFFEETLQDQYGNERSYHNFSSGEQRRIDLAILFAFQDIRRLQADVCINISIYDELLDSSLDRRGTELVLSLLRQRADKNKECVYIVSHRKEAQTTHTSRVIQLQKKNGITSLA